MKKQTVAVIGFGRFGQLLVDILDKHTEHDIKIISKQSIKSWSEKITITSDISVINTAQTIFPCVPIRHFKATIENIAPHLAQDATVIDVCSVKEHPSSVMLQFLPKSVNIIASHPMFGKASVEKNNNFTDLKWIFWNVRSKKDIFGEWKSAFNSLGFKIIEMKTEEHDALAARSQLFTQVIGLLMDRLKLENTPINTVWFESLLKIKAVVTSQNPELIEDMINFNPASLELLTDLEISTNKLICKLKNGEQKH